MQRRIAFTGSFGSGKSYLTKTLVGSLGGKKVSFASGLYGLVETAIGGKIDKSNPRHRELLIEVGTDWGRNGKQLSDPAIQERVEGAWEGKRGYPDIWVDALLREVDALGTDAPIFVDDLRFANEALALVQAGFTCITVACGNEERSNRLQGRGDGYAHRLDAGESERMTTYLSDHALSGPLMPVVWTGSDYCYIHRGKQWVLSSNGLLDCLACDASYKELSRNWSFGWQKFIHYLEGIR